MGFSVTWIISGVNVCVSQILSVLQNSIVEVFDVPAFSDMRSPEDKRCNLEDTQPVTQSKQNEANVSFLSTLCMYLWCSAEVFQRSLSLMHLFVCVCTVSLGLLLVHFFP